MKKVVFAVILIGMLTFPVYAQEIQPPQIPDSAKSWMPESESFGEGFQQILNTAMEHFLPDFRLALRKSVSLMASVMVISILQMVNTEYSRISELIGTGSVAALLLHDSGAMIKLGAEAVTEICEYGKLLLSVMTTAMAAQGGIAGSTALYAGTAVFNSILTSLFSRIILPMVYVFLAAAICTASLGEGILKGIRDAVKNGTSWCMKTLITVFTTYMSITGVVSGTTDAAALKATKIAISSAVPVVGGILSDASEAVLISAGLAKNAAGVYGILAFLAILMGPFMKIGAQYLVLKITGIICGIFGPKAMAELIGDFSTAMGLLLAMTGSACLLHVISTVCFLKGVG